MLLLFNVQSSVHMTFYSCSYGVGWSSQSFAEFKEAAPLLTSIRLPYLSSAASFCQLLHLRKFRVQSIPLIYYVSNPEMNTSHKNIFTRFYGGDCIVPFAKTQVLKDQNAFLSVPAPQHEWFLLCSSKKEVQLYMLNLIIRFKLTMLW